MQAATKNSGSQNFCSCYLMDKKNVKAKSVWGLEDCNALWIHLGVQRGVSNVSLGERWVCLEDLLAHSFAPA